jgi:hypothetical protein
MKGEAAARAKVMLLTEDSRSTDVRQRLDMLLQDLVVARARKEVFGGLRKRVGGGKQQIHVGGSGDSPEPLGLFLNPLGLFSRTSIPFI